MKADRPVVLVTGADGFVGRSMTKVLTEAGWHVRRAIRSNPSPGENSDTIGGLELSSSTQWGEALKDVQAVVHLAALTHRSTRAQQSDEASFMSVNVDGTAHLARSAIQTGVRDFIFLSSIAVHGRDTGEETGFSESSVPAPTTVYGHSKIAAEHKLADLAASSTMRITAIRPPMIYGPGARGNFHRLSAAVKAGIPLPFGFVKNRRAFLGVDNLSSFVTHCLATPYAPGFEVFLLADDEQVSTPEFVRLLGQAWGTSARILPFPLPLLRAGLDLIGSSDPLLNSLVIDTAKARGTGWRPKLSLADGLRQAAQQSG